MKINKLSNFLDNATQASRLGWFIQVTCEESVVQSMVKLALISAWLELMPWYEPTYWGKEGSLFLLFDTSD
jgi:hypothetical protein